MIAQTTIETWCSSSWLCILSGLGPQSACWLCLRLFDPVTLGRDHNLIIEAQIFYQLLLAQLIGGVSILKQETIKNLPIAESEDWVMVYEHCL